MTSVDLRNNHVVWRGWKKPEQLLPPNGYGDAEGQGEHPIKRLRLMKSKDALHSKRLVVVLHGLEFPGDQKVSTDSYRKLLELLFCGHESEGLADLLLVDYPNNLWVKRSVADGMAPAIGAAINQIHEQYENITLVGHSFGSLLARRVLVDAAENNQAWCRKTMGMIILAGTNLGFQYQHTSDLRIRALSFIAGLSDKFVPWLGDAIVYFLNCGRLLSYGWRNSEWVTDTRIKWFRLYEGNKTLLKERQGGEEDQASNKPPTSHFKTLYISATEDEFVGADDLQIVYQLGDFYCEHKIEGAFHADFLDRPGTGRKSVENRLNGDSVLCKMIQADVKTILVNSQTDENPRFHKVVRVSQLYRPQARRQIAQTESAEADQGTERTVVFLIHGIRDNAEWQEDIDYNLRSLHKEIRTLPESAIIHIAQVRYGYFNALQFLFPSERKRAVRSFSDEYLRVLARFPDLKQENIHVYAHSNGTFVFGQALKRYKEIKVNRVLLGGSVLPTDFPWRRYVNSREQSAGICSQSGGRRQVMQLLNYAANADWPTGLLCRGLSFLPGLDGPLLGVGPGGTDGFKDLLNFNLCKDNYKQLDKSATAGMVCGWNFFLKGDHGATLMPGVQAPVRIAEYLLGHGKVNDRTSAYSPEELDKGMDPFHGLSVHSCNQNPSLFRGFKGNAISVIALLLFLGLLLYLLGFSDQLPLLSRSLQACIDPSACPEVVRKIIPSLFKTTIESVNLKVVVTILLAYLLSRF
jgi:pimeloyl-ACP methyl ester carboxylesterase